MSGDECTCTPCTFPAYGDHGMTHCAECCSGTFIAEYDHNCPNPEHREWAAIQFPTTKAAS